MIKRLLKILFICFKTCCCFGQLEHIEIPMPPNKQVLDSTLNALRELPTTNSNFRYLKKIIERNLDISEEKYIAYFLRLLDDHSAELTNREIVDIHYYIAEEIYKILGYKHAWQYLIEYPKIETDLLTTHRLFLASLIFNNDMGNTSLSMPIASKLTSIYQDYNHPNQIRLLSSIGFMKGENNFDKEALKFYRLGLQKAKEFPNHKFIILLKINYLYFISNKDILYNKEISKVEINKEEINQHLNYIYSSKNNLWKLIGLSIKLSLSKFFKPSIDEINEDIEKGESIVKSITKSSNSHINNNSIAEFYNYAAIALNWSNTNNELANYYLDKSLKLYQENVNGTFQLIVLYKLKIESLQKTGNTEEIYKAYLSLDSLMARYHTVDKNNAIAQMNAKFNVEEERLKSDFLEKQNQRMYLLLLALASTLFISIFFGIRIVRGNRIKQKLNGELTKLNKKISQANHKITYQNNLLIGQKNDLEEELRGKLLLISTGYETMNMVQAEIRTSRITYSKKRQINRLFNDFTNSPLFDQIENDYISLNKNYSNKILKQHPKLTVNNLKLCILIKIGLSTKEIAQLTFRSPDSIKVAKSRLKKKLNIDAGIPLYSYLVSFENVPTENSETKILKLG